MTKSRDFPDDYYHADTGIYIPRLHGKPYNYWYQTYGCKNMKEIMQKAKELEEEERMNIVGQNGNIGYEEIEWCPDQRKNDEG